MIAFLRYVGQQLGGPTDWLTGLILGRIWNRRNAALNDHTLRQLGVFEIDHVLEVGFWGGYMLRRLKQQVSIGSVTGVDVSFNMAARLKRRYAGRQQHANNAEVVVAKAERLPFIAESFTKVCSVNSIFYWASLHDGIHEIARVTKSGGRVAITFTHEDDLKHRWCAQHGVNHYSVNDVVGALADSGFGSVTVSHGADQFRRFHCAEAVRLYG